MEIPDGTPDNTVSIAMTIPTQIRNQPLRLAGTFLTFQVDTRQSLAASATWEKLTATIRKLQLDWTHWWSKGVFLSKAKVESIIWSTPGLPRCVLQAGIAIP